MIIEKGCRILHAFLFCFNTVDARGRGSIGRGRILKVDVGFVGRGLVKSVLGVEMG